MTETAPKTLTREQLHDRVWETPMIRLAAEYGLSDNGLRKICRRLDVPCPPAGWWAKKAAGKKVAVTSLPAARPGVPEQATISPTPDDTGDLRRAVRDEAQRIGPIEIHARLVRPHPIIAGWIADHRKRQEDARRQRREWPYANWTVADFTASERRRHHVLHALFRALERRGATIGEDDRRYLFAQLCGEKIEFSCHEKSKQVTRPLTADEKRWETWNKAGVKKDLEPTGRLEFQIRAWLDQPLRKVWLETDRQSAESMLPEIIATFLVVGPLVAERARKREEQHRLWEEQQREREVERQRRQRDENRWKRFVQIAEDWKSSQLAREFVAALRQLDIPESEHVDGRSPGEWLDWAEAKADERDPVRQGIDTIFADVERVSAWTNFD